MDVLCPTQVVLMAVLTPLQFVIAHQIDVFFYVRALLTLYAITVVMCAQSLQELKRVCHGVNPWVGGGAAAGKFKGRDVTGRVV